MPEPNVKTAKKRKSLAKQENTPDSAKKAKQEVSQTPVLNKPDQVGAKPTPKKNKGQQKQNSAAKPVTPLPKTPGKPANGLGAATGSEKNANKQKRKNSTTEGDSSDKLKKFAGTSDLQEDTSTKKGKKRQHTLRKKIFEKANTNKTEAIEDLKTKISSIENKKELSKSAKRKLRVCKKLLDNLTGKSADSKPAAKKAKKSQGKRQAAKAAKSEGGAAKKPVAEDEESSGEESDYNVEESVKVDKVTKNVNTESDEGEEEEDSVEEEEDVSDEEEEADSDEGDGEEESDDEEVDDEDEEDAEESDSAEQDDGEDEEEGDSDENEVPTKKQKGKVPNAQKIGKNEKIKEIGLKELEDNKIVSKGQSRYVVFVGNLDYATTRDEIAEHFKQIGKIVSIRIPLHQTTNKPRGFAYLEVENEESYQKALSLHHSFIKGRRINVQYTQGGKKKGEERKKEIKAKNFKLHGMRKQGQLAGSVKETNKRSFRRNKNKSQKKSE